MSDPLRLRVIDAVVSALEAIKKENGYYFTPADVSTKAIVFQETLSYPRYSVALESTRVSECAYHQLDETMVVTIRGLVKSDDPVRDILKASQDIRAALEVSAVSGTLRDLGAIVNGGEMTTDAGMLSADRFGLFDLRFEILVSGYYDGL
jgi:hypothetical protein